MTGNNAKSIIPIVFISYRRDDTSGYARALHDKIVEVANSLNFSIDVFLDVETISTGDNFENLIKESLTSSVVFIVLIGKKWLSIGNANGRRLDDPTDYVRMEIITALNKNIPIFPVLLHDSKMPTAEGLPHSLGSLSKINAIEIRDSHFEDDFKKLMAGITVQLFENESFRAHYFSNIEKKTIKKLLFGVLIGVVFGGLIWASGLCSVDFLTCLWGYGIAGFFLSNLAENPSRITGTFMGLITGVILGILLFESQVTSLPLKRILIEFGVFGSILGLITGEIIDCLYSRITKE